MLISIGTLLQVKNSSNIGCPAIKNIFMIPIFETFNLSNEKSFTQIDPLEKGKNHAYVD